MKSYQYDGLVSSASRIEKEEYVLILWFNKRTISIPLPLPTDSLIGELFDYLNATACLPLFNNQIDFIQCVSQASKPWISKIFRNILESSPNSPLTDYEVRKTEERINTRIHKYSKLSSVKTLW